MKNTKLIKYSIACLFSLLAVIMISASGGGGGGSSTNEGPGCGSEGRTGGYLGQMNNDYLFPDTAIWYQDRTGETPHEDSTAIIQWMSGTTRNSILRSCSVFHICLP